MEWETSVRTYIRGQRLKSQSCVTVGGLSFRGILPQNWSGLVHRHGPAAALSRPVREILRPHQTIRSLPFQSAVLILKRVQLKYINIDQRPTGLYRRECGQFGSHFALHDSQLLTQMTVDFEKLLDFCLRGVEGIFHLHELLDCYGAVREIRGLRALREEMN